jgi:hypothetical protein
VTAARVLPDARLADAPEARPAFAEARRIPQVLDGIRCHCGCAELPDHRSLLSCFEGDAMAMDCTVCQGQARLAYRLHREGRTLGEIRASVDARFG